MESKKNTPPKGVLIIIGLLILMIIGYFVLSAVFPDIFQNESVGKKP